MNLFLLLFGNRTLYAEAAYRTTVLDLCLQHSVSYCDFRYDEKGNISFRCSLATARHLMRACRERGIPIECVAFNGVPALLWQCRRRAGLFFGLLVSLFTILISQNFIWDVRVVGNTTIPTRQILSELKECGFGVGSYIPKIRTGELENRVLIASDRISWISIYLDGTVARVQVIEHTEAPPKEDIQKPANLIATADGQIETVELYRGNCIVKIGQAVRKGDLLVSGLYDSDLYGYRYTRAAGRILARTEKQIRIEIPLMSQEKIYGEGECASVDLKFFDFSLKIFKRTGNQGECCDIIEKEKGIDMIGGHPLPISLLITERKPYSQSVVRRTPEQASTLAFAALERELSSLSKDTQLLQKRITTTLTDTSLVLECTVLCIENIAAQSEFEIVE